MNKYVVYKSIDKLPIVAIKLKTKGKIVWDKGIVYGIKPNQNNNE